MIFISSLMFYGFWRYEYLIILIISCYTDYWVGLKMEGKTKSEKKPFLLLSLGANLSILFYFKYLIFFAENAMGLAYLFGMQFNPELPKIVLPLGISFYTFQTISYIVDVYREQIKAEKDYLLYGCFVTFFPQLVAGPVLRAAEIISQLKFRSHFKWDDIFVGARRVLYGLFLKVALADNIAPLVDTGFSMPLDSMSALDVWTLAFLFGYQIYFDFSAYSHIALGSARLMGIHFPENFNYPYFSASPREFWRRWHISLSTWIRDYIYIPLVGVKEAEKFYGGLGSASFGRRQNMALLISWIVIGLWHGANWNFVVWGLFHAFLIFIYRLVEPVTLKLNRGLSWLGGITITLPLIMLGWIPFRAESLEDTFTMWGKIIDPGAYGWLGMHENAYLIATLIFFGLFICYILREKLTIQLKPIKIFYLIFDTFLISITAIIVIIFIRPINQFIYFQF
jgi:D-alanyl-lipoteichoic acid acyltransferase DltB (MBOAT superfamily)